MLAMLFSAVAPAVIEGKGLASILPSQIMTVIPLHLTYFRRQGSDMQRILKWQMVLCEEGMSNNVRL